ncbi:hypothetical protein KY329_00860 [Candidatus Woesearchaeota archaeon]|nr:hypothetical protein [Candidatus Woesearchaeota archaeon]
MAVKRGEGRSVIKHRGFFDLQAVLKAIQGFFMRDDYVPHWEQVKVRSNQYEVIFYAEKKETEWVKFRFDLHIWVYDLKKVEIVKEGKKVKMDDGKFICEIDPTLILDWQDRFEAKTFAGFVGMLKDLYFKYIMKKDIGDYWDDVLCIKSAQLAKIIQQKLGQEVL